MRRRSILAAVAAAAVLAPGAPGAGDAARAAQAVAPPGAPPPAGSLLSDEARVTRWAYANHRAAIRADGRPGARRVGRLALRTEDGYPEVYLLLRSRRDAAGRMWVRLRIPGRPNGRTGWVPRAALDAFHVARTKLRVNRRTLRATLFRDGRRIWSSRIGVGAPGTPTPAGRFWIREKFRVRGGGGVYGPYAFGTAGYSVLSDWPRGGVVGIHGTNRPGLIPGRPSHGCIRVPNRAILRLRRLMPIGTPVQIL
jgi:hypothetical protein